MECPNCHYVFKETQKTLSVSDAIEIANSEQTNNDSLGSCLWYNRVCELVGY